MIEVEHNGVGYDVDEETYDKIARGDAIINDLGDVVDAKTHKILRRPEPHPLNTSYYSDDDNAYNHDYCSNDVDNYYNEEDARQKELIDAFAQLFAEIIVATAIKAAPYVKKACQEVVFPKIKEGFGKLKKKFADLSSKKTIKIKLPDGNIIEALYNPAKNQLYDINTKQKLPYKIKAKENADSKKQPEKEITQEQVQQEISKLFEGLLEKADGDRKIQEAIQTLSNAKIIDKKSALEYFSKPEILEKVNLFLSQNPDIITSNQEMFNTLFGRNLMKNKEFIPLNSDELNNEICKITNHTTQEDT